MSPSTTRGLAASAVSALALTGLSLAATPAAHAAGPPVVLLSQSTGTASTRFADDDASSDDDYATRLTARTPTAGATVSFQFNVDPEASDADTGWVDLALPVTAHGTYYDAQWDGAGPGGRSYVGERLALRAVATSSGGTSYSTRRNVEVSGDGSAVDSVTVDTTAAGYFTQPYAGSDKTGTALQVTGYTSATSGTVALSWWRSSTGSFVGTTAAKVQKASFKVPSSTSTYVDGGLFTGVLDISGFDAAEGQVAVAAKRGSDDVAPIALTPQVITTVSAVTPAPVRTGESATVPVTVLDAAGEPIIGAEVRRGTDSALVGYTGVTGAVVATQAAGTTESYYANATDADAYDGSTDTVSSPVTIGTYSPVGASVQNVLGDGPVFDDDEYSTGDIAVQVLDQQGRPVGAGQNVSFKLYPTAAGPGATYNNVVTDAKGRATILFDPSVDGSYTLLSRLATADPSVADEVSTFTIGQAALTLNPQANPVTTAAGGQVDYVGRLAIGDTPLPGRKINLVYREGVEVVPGNHADAGILVGGKRVLRATVTTNANGTFRVTVDDAAEKPQATETGGVLTADTADNMITGTSTLDGDAVARDTSGTRFGTAGPGSAKLLLLGPNNGRKADSLRVAGPTSVAGETVKVFRVQGNGKRVLVRTRKLNTTGDLAGFTVPDANQGAVTTYVVRLVASKRVKAADSNTRKVT